LAQACAEIVASLVTGADTMDFVNVLSARLASLTGSQGVGVMVSKDGGDTLTFIGGFVDDATSSELFDVQATEGPSFDAFRTGRSVTETDLDNVYDRWPSFGPRAVKAGMASVFARPLRTHLGTVGVLNLVREDSEPVSPETVDIITTLADLAALGIVLQRTTAREQDVVVAAELLEASDELQRIGSVSAAAVVRDRALWRMECAAQEQASAHLRVRPQTESVGPAR
jgi:hypothetical protein